MITHLHDKLHNYHLIEIVKDLDEHVKSKHVNEDMRIISRHLKFFAKVKNCSMDYKNLLSILLRNLLYAVLYTFDEDEYR